MSSRRRSTLGRAGAITAAAAAAALLAACSRGSDDLHRYIEQTLQRTTPPPERFEPPEDLPSHRYPTDLPRDPFDRLSFVEPRATVEEASGPRPDPDRRREALEQYPLDALRMAGTLERDGQRWGLVRDPHGTVHRVTEGNFLGQNHGRIVNITERAIELEELVRVGENRWQQRSATLASRE